MWASDFAILAGKARAHVACVPQQLLVRIKTLRCKDQADDNTCKHAKIERRWPASCLTNTLHETVSYVTLGEVLRNNNNNNYYAF